MLNLLKKILDLINYIKDMFFNIIFGILFLFSFCVLLLFILYVLKSAIGIDIFEDSHLNDFFRSLEKFLGTLF
jgi:hypothetical protein